MSIQLADKGTSHNSYWMQNGGYLSIIISSLKPVVNQIIATLKPVAFQDSRIEITQNGIFQSTVNTGWFIHQET